MIQQVYNRLKLMIASGSIDSHDKGKASVGILHDEIASNVKMVTPYGFTHHPLPGSSAYMVFPDGDRSFGIALIVNDERHQFDVGVGEVAVYNSVGAHIHLKSDGSIIIYSEKAISVDAPQIDIVGNVSVDGNVIATGIVKGG